MGKFCWREAIESHVRPALIVVPAPGLDRRSRLSHRGEPVEVQTLAPERPVEAFDVRAIRRRSRARDVHPHLVMIRLQIDNLTGELRAIIQKKRCRRTTQLDEPVQRRHGVLAA